MTQVAITASSERAVGDGRGDDRGAQLVAAVAEAVGDTRRRCRAVGMPNASCSRVDNQTAYTTKPTPTRGRDQDGPAAPAAGEAERVREEHGADDGQREPAEREDASEAEGRRGAQRGEGESGERGGACEMPSGHGLVPGGRERAA